MAQHESGRAFWAFGVDPFGTGDSGGRYQMEPATHATAARLAHLPLSDLSAGAQHREALMLLRAYGADSSMTWGPDQCG